MINNGRQLCCLDKQGGEGLTMSQVLCRPCTSKSEKAGQQLQEHHGFFGMFVGERCPA